MLISILNDTGHDSSCLSTPPHTGLVQTSLSRGCYPHARTLLKIMHLCQKISTIVSPYPPHQHPPPMRVLWLSPLSASCNIESVQEENITERMNHHDQNHQPHRDDCVRRFRYSAHPVLLHHCNGCHQPWRVGIRFASRVVCHHYHRRCQCNRGGLLTAHGYITTLCKGWCHCCARFVSLLPGSTPPADPLLMHYDTSVISTTHPPRRIAMESMSQSPSSELSQSENCWENCSPRTRTVSTPIVRSRA